ncbi:response regulator receiver protein [Dehalogenimonas lykanthroporepellens BL-DC-9]|jgi:CheY-like chemotaxis protein|nr:response regulator receiver protein [Dehalogenimonas lykanthroporepellens BL-DC-9]
MVKKVLIVDDQEQIRLLVCGILKDEYEVLEAGSGEEALQVAREYLPDLIIMDILMPGMDGLTACSQIKSNPATNNIPVLVLTIIDYELNRRFAESLGADGYITKPFTPEELRKAVSEHLKSPAA